jgi:hypothetical protein
MLPGNCRLIGAWQSAQTLFPTYTAPGISGGSKASPVIVAQELRKTPAAASVNPIAAATKPRQNLVVGF